MKRLFFCLLMAFVVIMPLRMQAQIIDPVKWSVSIEDLNENEFDLVATATIDPEYHIYSTKMPDLAPLPTVFEIQTSEFFEAVGEARDLTEVPLFYDDIFEVEYKQFGGTASFAQTFRKLKDGTFPITGEISYQACKDGQCVSLTEDVNLQYGEPAVIEAAEHDSRSYPLGLCRSAHTLRLSNDSHDGVVLHARRRREQGSGSFQSLYVLCLHCIALYAADCHHYHGDLVGWWQ